MRKVVIESSLAAISPYESGLEIVLGEREPDTKASRVPQTWVMAGTMNTLFDDEPASATADETTFMTVLFERCLAAINLFTQTTRLMTKEVQSRPLVKETLDPTIVWFRLDPPSSNLGPRRTIDLHHRPYNPVFGPDDELSQGVPRLRMALGLRLAAEASPAPHPLVLPRALAIQALGQRYRGDAVAGIVTLQASAEGVLRGVHRLLLTDAGLTHQQISSAADVPFSTLLSRELPRLLLGNWVGNRSAVTQYRSLLYELRNEIVHGGREPLWSQVNPAFDAYEHLQEFLSERIRARWRLLPRTLAAWSEPWAGGSEDGLSRSARDVIGELRLEAMPYWVPKDIAQREH